jgi:4-hydroxythreonine-4-phosphate dehydrogenase
MQKPLIALTMGDAAGIGPELVAMVLGQGATYDRCAPLVIGDPQVMAEACRIVGSTLRVHSIDRLDEARCSPPDIDVLRPRDLRIDRVQRGALDPALGHAAAVCLRTAFELARDGKVRGVVSAPLNKEAFHLAGYDYLDELAYLADLTGSREPFIIGLVDQFATIAVTEHVPFREVADLITKERVLRSILALHAAMARLRLAEEAMIAVAALNVHGGEGGLFGREEIDAIGPAVQEARAQGLVVQGPIPADTVFVRAREGEFNGVVCMYHDQANIARKLLATRRGATLFMGLPVICGTTAHGTAFDKAGQGIADPGSLATALRCVAMLAEPGQ